MGRKRVLCLGPINSTFDYLASIFSFYLYSHAKCTMAHSQKKIALLCYKIEIMQSNQNVHRRISYSCNTVLICLEIGQNIINLACIRSLLNQFLILKSLPVFLYEFLKFECGALVTSRVLCCWWWERRELVTSLSQRTQTLRIRIKKREAFRN